MAITGRIILTGGTVINISDDIVVANSVSITMSTCRESRFDFGTFNAAVLKMGIVDDDVLQHDFTDAVVQISETYTDEEGDEIQIDLGDYTVDGTTVKRERNAVMFSAYDASLAFDKDITDNDRETTYTASTAIQAACTACGVSLEGSIPSGSPNTAVSFKLSSLSIQTWRDVVMWSCQLICANAVINRAGLLEIRQAWADMSEVTPDFTCTAADRHDIKFSDKRTYLKYMTAHSGKAIKTYTSSLSAPSQAVPGQMTLSKNPLLDDTSETDCDTINAAILTKPIEQRQISAKMFSNSEISLGDIGAFIGGKIDVRRQIGGMVTGITWRYHGFTTVICSAPEAAAEGGS